jgi:hypothetical protein
VSPRTRRAVLKLSDVMRAYLAQHYVSRGYFTSLDQAYLFVDELTQPGFWRRLRLLRRRGR